MPMGRLPERSAARSMSCCPDTHKTEMGLVASKKDLYQEKKKKQTIFIQSKFILIKLQWEVSSAVHNQKTG